jgi:hypothetical protein
MCKKPGIHRDKIPKLKNEFTIEKVCVAILKRIGLGSLEHFVEQVGPSGGNSIYRQICLVHFCMVQAATPV